jgi:hypothetical protein
MEDDQMEAWQASGSDGRARSGKSRTETISVRLDPKLRYLAELAARKQRRTLSSFVEWAIDDSLDRVVIDEAYDQESERNYPISLSSVGNQLWDVEEADRFAKLALRYPPMLNHIEQIIWKLVRENGFFWRGNFNKHDRFYWEVAERNLVFDRLRDYWEILNKVARGEAEKSALPTWSEKRTTPKSDAPVDDEEIPF